MFSVCCGEPPYIALEPVPFRLLALLALALVLYASLAATLPCGLQAMSIRFFADRNNLN